MCNAPKTQFASLSELALLPWFHVAEGRLKAARVGPVVDLHTHLAISAWGSLRIDPWEEHARTRHYLPMERPLDLDVYVNKNLTPGDLRRLKVDLGPRSFMRGGMRATHTAANLLREMDDVGVAASTLLPIDFPWRGSRTAEAYLEVAARPGGLISFGSVHPSSKDIDARLDAQQAAGARGIKVHPAVQKVAPEHPRALELYRRCAARGLVVLWHCGPVGIESSLSRRLCQIERYAQAIEACPEVTFILGHSGALAFEGALALARKHENVYMESSCQSLTNVARMIREAPPERLLFGSDWPFYHQAIPLAKVLLATEGLPARREQLLWENAARLLNLDLEALGAARQPREEVCA